VQGEELSRAAEIKMEGHVPVGNRGFTATLTKWQRSRLLHLPHSPSTPARVLHRDQALLLTIRPPGKSQLAEQSGQGLVLLKYQLWSTPTMLINWLFRHSAKKERQHGGLADYNNQWE